MAILPQITRAVTQMSTNEGRIRLSTSYPDEVEYYMMAFELEGEDGIVDRFIFPVLPSRFNFTDQKNTTIRRTNSGTTILTDNSFTNKEIQIGGNFGRKFKLIFGNFERETSEIETKKPEYDLSVKTGYALIKRLERLFTKSTELSGAVGKNNNKPYLLYFYNLSFNQKYIVELLNFSASMDESTNMIWNYNLTMRAVAPATGLFDISKLSEFATQSSLSNSANLLVDGIVDEVVKIIR